MRYIITLLIILCANGVNAQISDDGLTRVKRIGLDTTLSGAAAFNETLIRDCIPGYKIKFVDNPHDGGTEIKYLYEHANTSILKIDYTYRFSGKDSTGKARPSIFSQRITADMESITLIYNYLFGANAKPDELDAYRGDSFDVVYQDRDYHYSLIPDDYRPGYWILTFTP